MRASRVLRSALEAGPSRPQLLEHSFVELWAAFPGARRELRRLVTDVARAFGVEVDADKLEPGRMLEALTEAALDAVPGEASEARRRRAAAELARLILFLALDTALMELGVGLD